MLVFAIAMPASPVYPADENLWDRWNIAPYASSIEEAYKNAPEAIDGFTSMPLDVKEYFKSVLKSVLDGTCGRRTSEVWLDPGMKLEQMWSGGQHPYVMSNITVGELPVLKSPDGKQTYSSGSVAQTAKALHWSKVSEGNTWDLYLPYVCFNFCWASSPTPAPAVPVEQCATVKFTVMPGDEVRFAVLARKPLPSSSCWQLCDGLDCAMFPSPCDTCGWWGPKLFIPAEFKPLHTGRYIAKSPEQTLRFPIDVMSEYVVLCDDRTGRGESDSWIIQPSAWTVGVMTITVPYGGQEWPAWGQVDLSKWK